MEVVGRRKGGAVFPKAHLVLIVLRERDEEIGALLTRSVAISVTSNSIPDTVAACQPKSTDFEWPDNPEQATLVSG